jgi:hypothetical protein
MRFTCRSIHNGLGSRPADASTDASDSSPHRKRASIIGNEARASD